MFASMFVRFWSSIRVLVMFSNIRGIDVIVRSKGHVGHER